MAPAHAAENRILSLLGIGNSKVIPTPNLYRLHFKKRIKGKKQASGTVPELSFVSQMSTRMVTCTYQKRRQCNP
jgi:hypothetical protein